MKYSIIIPHYNRPDLIMNTINSFKELKDKEIIIVDDVSTIDNLNKLKDNVRKLNDLSISIITPPTKLLLPGTRNKGIELAKGEWIFFIDDDDEATPNFIKWLNSSKQKKKYDFYRFPNIERLNGKNKMYIFKWWHKKYSAQVSTYLFNKNFFMKNKIRFNDKVSNGYGEDFWLMVEIFDINKIKSKYIHHFSIYYNRFDNAESFMRKTEENPQKRLELIRHLLKSNFKNKNAYALSFLVGDFFFSYKKNVYTDDKKTYEIYLNLFNQINPGIKEWWNIYLPWKIQLISFKKYLKKMNKKFNI